MVQRLTISKHFLFSLLCNGDSLSPAGHRNAGYQYLPFQPGHHLRLRHIAGPIHRTVGTKTIHGTNLNELRLTYGKG